ncbi:aminoacyl-tRNA hydrolase [Roseivivax sp.]
MKLFVGLGNPGRDYAGHRHNIGFMALDAIAEAHGLGPWKQKFQGELAEGRLGADKVLLLKPMTYMNRSGQSVGEVARFYKLGPEDVVVFHDELDLAPARLKVKEGGGHAGHNGLRSIHAHLGEAYQRVRLGIGHPGHKDLVSRYVLHDFAKEDAEWLDDLMRGIADGAPDLADGDKGGFMNKVSLRVAPARSSKSEGGKAAKGGGPAKAKGGAASDKPAAKGGASESPAAAKAGASGGKAAAAEAPETPEADDRSPLQKLVDRFR